MSNKRLNYNLVDWSEYFEYSESSKTGLIWRYGNNCLNQNLRSDKGDPAGVALYYKSGKPRAFQVFVKGKNYLVHRIIWCLIHGEISDNLEIDHIDGNGFNNMLWNLRLVEKSLNTRNCSLRKDSVTGRTGVYKMENGGGNTYYVATWYENNKQKSKYFNIEKLGETNALSLATEFRRLRIEELNQIGMGYTERHGT